MAKAGDVITLTFVCSEILLQLPVVTIAGNAASMVVYISSTNGYITNYTVSSQDAQGLVLISISGLDLASNTQTQSSVTDSSYVIIDTVPPTFNSVSIRSTNANSSMATTGDAITVLYY